MKNPIYARGLRLWIEGLLLLSLRWAERKNGFDPATGLSLHSTPGLILAAAILFLAAVELFLCFRGIPGGKRTYLNCLAPMEKSCLAYLSSGSVLLAAGGTMLLFANTGTLSAATAAAGLAAMAGFVFFPKTLRSGERPKVYPMLPVMVFSVLFVLVIYLPEESNPVLARYYLPVLAASMASCAFYQLAGLTLREGSLRWFVFFGDLAVPLCLAAMADSDGNIGRTMVYMGYATALTAFLLTRRDELLPEPEPEKGESGDEAEPAQG